MQQLQCDQLMDGCRVVPGSVEMVPDNSLKSAFLQVGARQGQRIEQYLAHVLRQLVAIPDSEMEHLMSAQEQTLQA